MTTRLIRAATVSAGLVMVGVSGADAQLQDESPVLHLRISIPEDARPTLLASPRTYVAANILCNEVNFTNVAFHLKGNYGTFQPLERKPSLTLNFDKFTKGQHFHGMDKLHLNNSVSDPSFMTELLCRELFAAAGLPAARVSHARVSINDRDRGLYVLVEGHDKTFLRRFFSNANGNLYDSEYLHDITDALRRASGKRTNDHADLKALAQAAREFAGRPLTLPSPPAGERVPEGRVRGLEDLLDMDRFYSFLALETLTCHFDGYARGKNNYWIYHDPTSDKIVFIPHGMDQMFTQPESSLFPEFKGMLARSILATSQGRERYRERCALLFTNLFLAPNGGNGTWLSNRVVQLQTKLRPEITTLGTNAVAEHDRAVSNLHQRITARIAHLRRHLLVPAPPLTALSPGASISLTNFQPSVESGMARLTVTNSTGRTNVMQIRMDSPDKPAFAAWESRVRLPSGKYQIAASVESERPVFRGPRNSMSLKVWGGEDMQFESTRPDPRHLELVRTIFLAAEEEVLIQCGALSSGEPLLLEIGPVLVQRIE